MSTVLCLSNKIKRMKLEKNNSTIHVDISVCVHLAQTKLPHVQRTCLPKSYLQHCCLHLQRVLGTLHSTQPQLSLVHSHQHERGLQGHQGSACHSEGIA